MRPSRRLIWLALLLHLAAFGVCLGAFYGWPRIVGVCALAYSAYHARQVIGLRRADSVRKIMIDNQQRAAILTGNSEGRAESAVLHGSTAVMRHALFLCWHTGSGKNWQLVLPDMTDADSYRRLRVWVRWCQTKENSALRPSEKETAHVEN
nr:protein YgfX [Neisseria perflava]